MKKNKALICHSELTEKLCQQIFRHPELRKANQNLCHSELVSESLNIVQSHEMLNVVIPRKNTQSLLQHDKESLVKKCAFTLAEVLITLSILGVVAAIAIPSIIQNYQKQATVSRLKMAYSILDNMTQLSYIENGFPPHNRYMTLETFDKYFKPYLNIQKDCGLRTSSKVIRGDNCFKNNGFYDMDNTFNTGGNGGWGFNYYYTAVLKNGMSLAVYSGPQGFNDTSILFIVDIDGPNKGLSKMGQDLFTFGYNSPIISGTKCKQNGILPFFKRYPKDLTNNNCTMTREELLNSCRETGSGWNCGGLIIKDGWIISSDYPWSYAHKK